MQATQIAPQVEAPVTREEMDAMIAKFNIKPTLLFTVDELAVKYVLQNRALKARNGRKNAGNLQESVEVVRQRLTKRYYTV